MKRVAVIGGGLVGLATARALLRRGDLAVTVYEKERDFCLHQSTHNSGVLHAGLYYTPGSHRAVLARTGIRSMTEFCQEHDVPHEICGKLVVAVAESEVPRLRALLERGTQNGLRGLRWLEPDAAREIEPHVRCVAAVHVPEEGIVDFRVVCDVIVRQLRALDCTLRTRADVVSLTRQRGEWRIRLRDGSVDTADIIANCAAQDVDRLAHTRNARIIPFRGEYYHLRAEREHLVRHLIYPVPDSAFPFLGVHLTRTVHGRREAGPNAALAFSRAGYRFRDVDARDLGSTLTWPGFWRFLARHPRMVARELHRSLSRTQFVHALQRLVPEITEHDLEYAGSGVRMQSVDRAGRLANDFMWQDEPAAVHVLSAPSPAATASLVIGDEVAARIHRIALGT